MDYSPLIRLAQPNDITSLAQLAAQTYADAFGHSMSAADLAAHLEKNLSPASFQQIIANDTMLVAEADGQLVGYVQFGPAHPASGYGEGAELRRLYVRADAQNAGVGTLLMEAALEAMKGIGDIYLDVWEHNAGAQRLYRRFGFEMIGTRAFEVASGAETSLDLIMVRRR